MSNKRFTEKVFPGDQPDPVRLSPAAVVAALNGDFANALVAMTPGGIERQEAEGQRQLVQSTQLPRRISNATQDQLKEIGFKFGDTVDDLFVEATLPEGWSKVATTHSMWTDLIDDQGRKRGGIFYKAAFYDRNADMRFDRRYSVDTYRELNEAIEAAAGTRFRAVEVMDTATNTQVYYAGAYDSKAPKYWEELDKLEAKAVEYLTANYPDYRNPFAYW